MSAARLALAGFLTGTALALCAGCTAATPPALRLPEIAGPPTHPEHLILVSVAGLTSDRYRARGSLPSEMPALAQLARAGVAVDAVRPAMPATAYPTHATLVTGVSPAAHGIVADRRIGNRGVREARYWHASQLRAPTLWQLVAQSGRRVAALGWPSTAGASIDLLLSDLLPTRRGETWLGVLADGATPEVLALAERAGGAKPAANRFGPARDAVLARVACDLLSSPEPPALMLLRLSQTLPSLAVYGPESEATRAAFAEVDAELARLVGCLLAAGRLSTAALVVSGDHGTLPVHTAVAANSVLASEGLIDAQGWSAIVRSNGGSAFVYARDEEIAVHARHLLATEAERTRTFRVLSAQTMMAHGADPDAWFGLEAEPGFVFDDALQPPLLRPAAARAAAGYLPERAAMQPGLVAWGRGIRGGVRVPAMDQIDVAPTLARLLGIDLPDAQGRVLVGLLSSPHAGGEAR